MTKIAAQLYQTNPTVRINQTANDGGRLIGTTVIDDNKLNPACNLATRGKGSLGERHDRLCRTV